MITSLEVMGLLTEGEEEEKEVLETEEEGEEENEEEEQRKEGYGDGGIQGKELAFKVTNLMSNRVLLGRGSDAD